MGRGYKLARLLSIGAIENYNYATITTRGYLNAATALYRTLDGLDGDGDTHMETYKACLCPVKKNINRENKRGSSTYVAGAAAAWPAGIPSLLNQHLLMKQRLGHRSHIRAI
eukprot:scaffold197106_cov18-Prasinocladus_malaysianus.AAC.1